MTRKRILMVGLALVGVLVIGIGVAAAQGPRNGQRGAGAGAGAYGAAASQMWQNQTAQPGTGLMVNNRIGTRQQLRSMDPLNPGTGNQYGRGNGNAGLYGTQYDLLPPFEGELPADVVEALQAGLMDELHAAAVYEAVIAQFGPVVPFSSILQAEYTHAAALERAMDYYGVDYSALAPAVEPLAFSTVQEACAAAAAAEVANFTLYDNWIDTVSDYPDLVQVFTNLRNASEYNHLPAFEACAG
ncbi:MAG: hypothetical protein Kow0077_21540 [Anaerolineae bacterium]